MQIKITFPDDVEKIYSFEDYVGNLPLKDLMKILDLDERIHSAETYTGTPMEYGLSLYQMNMWLKPAPGQGIAHIVFRNKFYIFENSQK